MPQQYNVMCSFCSTPEDDGDVVVQAGVPWEDLNQTLKDKGIPLFFPVCVTLEGVFHEG